jgi:hypothetical protein
VYVKVEDETVAIVDHAAPATLCCTLYPVMAEPLFAGAVQPMVTLASFENVEVMFGVVGTVAGVTGVASAVDGPVPALLTADTRKLYAVPLVSPLISNDNAVTLLSTVTHEELPES